MFECLTASGMKKWIALALMLLACVNAWAGTITGKVIAVKNPSNHPAA